MTSFFLSRSLRRSLSSVTLLFKELISLVVKFLFNGINKYLLAIFAPGTLKKSMSTFLKNLGYVLLFLSFLISSISLLRALKSFCRVDNLAFSRSFMPSKRTGSSLSILSFFMSCLIFKRSETFSAKPFSCRCALTSPLKTFCLFVIPW